MKLVARCITEYGYVTISGKYVYVMVFLAGSSWFHCRNTCYCISCNVTLVWRETYLLGPICIYVKCEKRLLLTCAFKSLFKFHYKHWINVKFLSSEVNVSFILLLYAVNISYCPPFLEWNHGDVSKIHYLIMFVQTV